MRITLLIGAALLAGCQTAQPAMESTLSPDFGAAVKTNIAAMAIAPRPEDLADTYIAPDRARQQLALERYRADEVADPKLLSTRKD